MGRDRDPFERSLMALRQRVTAPEAARGLALPVLPLAAELGVSSTPVREALAHLAGEGLVVRSRSGYHTKEQDRASLAAHYGLVLLLVEAAMTNGLAPDTAEARDPPQDAVQRLPERVGNRALSAAVAKALWQLAPYREAELAVFGIKEGEAMEAALLRGAWGAGPATVVRAYFRRRASRAGEILGRAMGPD